MWAITSRGRLLNHILTAQYPGMALPQYAGMTSYFTSFVGGHWKHFHTPDNDMWCCTGTGLENHSRYGDSIYFHNGGTLYVNLFIASTLDWSEKGVTIRQDTLFPQEQGTTLTIHTAQPQSLAIRIRIPYWATSGVSVQVNGQNWPVNPTPSTFVEVNRIWDDSDILHITLPMSLRMDRFVDNNSLGTIFYGPVLLAGALGTYGFTPDMQWGGGFTEITVPKVYPVTATVSDWVKPVGGQPLTFQTKGAGVPSDFTLIPFYKLFDQRYNLYWQLTAIPPDLSISSLATLDDGAIVSFTTKAVTLAPRNASGQRSTNYFYIEDPDRAAAIRVEGPSVGYDNVNVGDCPNINLGTLRRKTTTTGERYIDLATPPTTTAGQSPAPSGHELAGLAQRHKSRGEAHNPGRQSPDHSPGRHVAYDDRWLHQEPCRGRNKGRRGRRADPLQDQRRQYGRGDRCHQQAGQSAGVGDTRVAPAQDNPVWSPWTTRSGLTTSSMRPAGR